MPQEQRSTEYLESDRAIALHVLHARRRSAKRHNKHVLRAARRRQRRQVVRDFLCMFSPRHSSDS